MLEASEIIRCDTCRTDTIAPRRSVETHDRTASVTSSSSKVNPSSALRSPDAKDNKELLALSLKAAEAALKLAGEKDAIALYFVAEAHFANGDKAKAKDFGAKAVAAADSDGLKKQLENLTKKFDDEKKEK